MDSLINRVRLALVAELPAKLPAQLPGLLMAMGSLLLLALISSIMASAVIAAPLGASLDAPLDAPINTAAQYIALPGGMLRTVLPPDGKSAPVKVAPFLMRARLVSNAQYREFLLRQPNWQRGQIPTVMADASHQENWAGPLDFAPLLPDAPVTQVSWFAASAFCASEGGRLPTWAEWEYAAAADETRADARGDPAWLLRILSWYSRPAKQPPGQIGQTLPNFYGVYDLQNLVWEWVEDFNGLFVSSDSRASGQGKQLDYCGGAALSLADKENYAVLMRLALLGAMEARRGGPYLGFRCVQDLAPASIRK